MNVHDYLVRIGVEPLKKLDLPHLAVLQRRHLQTVPVERLDVPGPVDLAAAYAQVVAEGRGAAGHALNALFGDLLARLGFDVAFLAATVPGGADHLALLLTLDRPFLVDVGLADGPRAPLPLTGEPVADVVSTWHARPDGENVVVERLDEDAWTEVYRATRAPRALAELAGGGGWRSAAPEVPLAGLITPEGRVELWDDRLVVMVGDRRIERPVDAGEERRQILKDTFGIGMDEA